MTPRAVFTSLSLAAAAVGMACGDGAVSGERRVAVLEISRDNVTLDVGDTVQLRAEARDVDGAPIVEAT